MKTFLKNTAINLFGHYNARKIKKFLFPYVFSEDDLILKYFDAETRQGLMLDVGVHYGQSFIEYAKKGWQIIGFEPDPLNRKYIPAKNKIKLYENAVSDKDGLELEFYRSSQSTGISSLTPFEIHHKPIGIVKTITLSTVVEKENIKKIDYLKIDIEGHDFFAIKGFPFHKLKPELIMCEFEDYKTIPLGYSFRDIGDYLLSKGYSVWLSEWHPLTKYGGKHVWREMHEYPCELLDKNANGNFIAIDKSCSKKFESVAESYIAGAKKKQQQ